MNYEKITSLEYVCNCSTCGSLSVWNKLMKGAVRANKKKINSLVKRLLPDLYESLALNYHNPYKYFRTKTHLVLVHSSIEYFLRF